MPQTKSNFSDQLGALNTYTYVSISALARFVLNRLYIVVIGISSMISREQIKLRYLSLKLEYKFLASFACQLFSRKLEKTSHYLYKNNELCDNILAQTNFSTSFFELVSELFHKEAIFLGKISGTEGVDDRVVHSELLLKFLLLV